MDLECIILSEISQTEKDKYHLIPLYVKSKNKTNKRKKKKSSIAKQLTARVRLK